MRISDWSSDVCSSDLAVLDYLDRTDPEAARTARERYGCLMPWARDPADYGRVALDPGFERCERAVLAALRDLLDSRSEYILRDGADYFDAAQNARLVATPARYYRAMYYGAHESWNLRDRHMLEPQAETLNSRTGARAAVGAHTPP